jgi:hypothetical protein
MYLSSIVMTELFSLRPFAGSASYMATFDTLALNVPDLWAILAMTARVNESFGA